MKQFHLLDVLAHDLVIESEDENTKQGYFEQPYQDADSEGEFVEESPRKSSQFIQPRKELYIELFGVVAEGTPVHLKVTGFRPFFYIGLQKKTDAATIKKHILEKLRKNRPSIETDLQFEEVQRKVLFGYTGNSTFPMLKVSMPSRDLFYGVRNLFLNKAQKPILRIQGREKPVQVYEANLDPMLRFFHIQDLEPCGWIEADCDFEFDTASGRLLGDCDWSQVKPPKQKPGKSGSYKLAAWDIECYSPTGDFPVPEKDPVIQIGVVLVQGTKSEKHIFVNHTCEPVDGCVVHSQPKDNERAMLLDWAGWMAEQDPDVLVGYNIFGFDERYLWKRAQLLGIDQSAAFQALSRLEGEEVKLAEKMLSSSALGDNRLYTWTTPGRLQIDLYHYIRRLENLTSYKLDDVTSHYMSGKLKGIRQEGTTLILKTAITKEAVVGRSVKLLDETGEAIGDKLVISAIGAGEITLTPQEPVDGFETAVKWAIVKDDVSPQEIFKLHRGNAADRAKLAAYCIQDCNLVVELFNKLDVFNNAMSMANVCSVPVSYIFTRGQGIKIESLIFKECNQRGQAVIVLEAPGRNFAEKGNDDEEEEEEDSYEGAIVFDPVPDFYFDAPVGVCDFASLYPSSIISENISYDTLLWVKDYDMSGNLVKTDWVGSDSYVEPGTRWTDIEFDIWRPDPNDTRKHPVKIKSGLRVCRYAQYTGDRKGTLPDILQKLLAARKAKRKQAEKESDPFVKALLDAEQLAYKLTANSLYGQLGSATFKIRLQHLAASTTAYGRKQITFAKTAIEQFYGPPAKAKTHCAEIVYGDTDSLFVSFNPRDSTGKRLEGREALVRTIELTEECGRFVTQALKPPHDFEYDKVFWPFIIFSKKRYVGNKYEENPDEFKQTSMGIVLKRRDNAPIVKTIYGGAIQILLNQRNVAKAAEFVREKCNEMMEGNTSLGQLTITKSLKANYKDPTKIAHKVLADRIAQRDPGNAPAPGDRIPYVYIQTDGQVALQGDKIELPSYIRAKNLKPDVQFYIEHQLTNPLSQLFSLRVEEIPGYRAPHSWPENDDKRQVARERMAAELLFNETLRMCERNERNKAASKMGFTVSASGSKSQRTRTVPIDSIPAGPKVQMRLDSWFADKLLVESKDKQKKQKQKENGPKPKSTTATASKAS
jgi:DNA polymerase elongation subunit (family B)